MTPRIFDYVVRTAMLAMAGLVTLSILGAIAAMTNDPGTRFAPALDRPIVEGERPVEEQAAQAPAVPEGGNASSAAPGRGQGPGVATAAARPSTDDEAARWLEAIAYALLAIAGVGALGVLMLWQVARELRRIGRGE